MATTSRTSRRALLISVAVASTAVPLHGVMAAGQGGCSGISHLPGTPHWTSIATGLPTITASAASGRALLVSDGRVIERTTNGGCTWAKVLDLDAPSGVATAETLPPYGVTSLHAPTGSPYVYAVLNQTQVAYADPARDSEFFDEHPVFIEVSRDGGVTWTLRQVLAGPDDPRRVVAAIGAAKSFAVSTANPRVAYLVTERYPEYPYHQDPIETLLTTSDGGSTWRIVSQEIPMPTGAPPAFPMEQIRTLVVEPGSTKRLWATSFVNDASTHPPGIARVRMSADGGKTWTTKLEQVGYAFRSLQVQKAGRGPLRLAVWKTLLNSGEKSSFFRSDDGGAHWRPLELQPNGTDYTPLAESAGFGTGGSLVVVESGCVMHDDQCTSVRRVYRATKADQWVTLGTLSLLYPLWDYMGDPQRPVGAYWSTTGSSGYGFVIHYDGFLP